MRIVVTGGSGHIVGPGRHPIGPRDNPDPAVWPVLAAAGTLKLHGSGTETLHHVQADDVAQAIELAIAHRDAAAGEDFNILAPAALSVCGYVAIASGWFGQAATLESVSWEQYRTQTTPEYAQTS